MQRSFSALRLASLSTILSAVAVACAATGTHDPGSGAGSGSSSGSGSGSGSGGSSGSSSGSFVNPATQPVDGKAPRAQRCDDAGRCTCFNIASIGLPGHTGFQSGMDSTTAFTDWLNTQSSAQVDMYTARPTLNAEFLNKYDVLIIQWLVDGISGENGTGYWTFTSVETDALAAWVKAGGGLITLSGYDAQAQEVTPLNQLVQATTDMSYGMADVLGTVSTANYCLGESDPLGGWVQSTPLGKHIEEVGAFHGRPINPGPKAVVDCTDGTNVYAAHEDVGDGHVFAYTDEWVTYTSQWFGIDAGGSCVDASADTVYQVPQFWYNAITYASQATACPFTLNAPITR